jgi:hypothetical protein
VGLSVWTYSFSATEVIGDDYVEEVLDRVDIVRERFTVAHIAYDGTLSVWIYNYGNVTIKVDVYVRGDAEGSDTSGTQVEIGEIKPVTLNLAASTGNELTIEVVSRRQNFIYETYVVPPV